jgi:primosomal protein N'
MQEKQNRKENITKKDNKILKVMKLYLAITLLFVLSISAENSFSQTKSISVDLNGITLKQAFNEIENSSDYLFIIIDNAYSELNRRVDADFHDKSINEILDIILDKTDLVYTVVNRQVTISREKGMEKNRVPEAEAMKSAVEKVMQQNRKVITGNVHDDNGISIIGANIVEMGTTNGTITDVDGNFTLEVANNASIQVSYIGYIAQVINTSGQTRFTITLVEDIESLEEIVVVGYGTQRKASLTGSVDQVSSEVFENRTVTNVTQGLQGVIPNLNIKPLDGRPNQAPAYNIRGTTSIGQGGDALILIDGVEGDPSLINPNDIESISVLKDAASASIYGARGAFGVVLITTKNPAKEKMNLTYTTNLSLKNPVVMPDYVWDGYTWAKMFNESHYNWEGSFPSAANKTIRFSQEYLEQLKYRSEHPNEFAEQWEINPANGEYVYYYSTNWYEELYKKFTVANEHNVTLSGSTGKLNYMVTGRYMGQNGLFRYNTDKYDMMNFRGKGNIQIFPWLNIDNNTQFSSTSYHTPLNVGEGSGVWRNISDEGNPMSPMFNPDGTLSHTAVYHVGDMWYGKNGYDNERAEIWSKMMSEDPFEIILGVRSSIFLPFNKLGLVIIDEEHEISFKQQDPSPRYHARDTAIMLAHLCNAKTILGSATPSLESFYNTKTGKYGLVTLQERYKNIMMPEIQIVNTFELRKRKKMKSVLAPLLIDQMNQSLENGEQVILFRNRRGFASLVECEQCAWTPKCKRCDVSLTYHKKRDRLICHYCNATYTLPAKCPSCNSENLKKLGQGTEQLEEEVESLFPDYFVGRMDLDTTRGKDAYEKIIDDFQSKRVQILIGTQMLSKGLDFENVGVVGVISADSLLNFPDFRSHERGFQLMMQAAGRAGRKNKQGKVIIQSADPLQPVYDYILNYDYEGFFNSQMAERKMFNYPPFSRLISIIIKDKIEHKVEAAAGYLAELLRITFGEMIQGPGKPIVSYIQSYHFREILIKLDNNFSLKKTREAIKSAESKFHSKREFKYITIQYDVDRV